MKHAALHRSLEDLAAESIDASAHIDAVEAHASEGCSACARALVNARDLVVDLATSADPTPPSSGLRHRFLANARAAVEKVAIQEKDGARRGRVVDASGAVAHLHLAGADEAARTQEIDELDAIASPPGDAAADILAEIARFVPLPVLFVSLVRGERVAYRVQRGLPEAFSGFRELRREMSYCTHCVSVEAPLVVEDARKEAFFRGSAMVSKFHCVAYVGVPLKTSRDVIVGTLCALGFAPERVPPALVELLEHFAAPMLSVLGAKRGVQAEVRDEAGVYASAWFERLVELAPRARAGAVLLRAPASSGPRLALSRRPGDVLGRLASGELGLLLAGEAASEASQRAEELAATARVLG